MNHGQVYIKKSILRTYLDMKDFSIKTWNEKLHKQEEWNYIVMIIIRNELKSSGEDLFVIKDG